MSEVDIYDTFNEEELPSVLMAEFEETDRVFSQSQASLLPAPVEGCESDEEEDLYAIMMAEDEERRRTQAPLRNTQLPDFNEELFDEDGLPRRLEGAIELEELDWDGGTIRAAQRLENVSNTRQSLTPSPMKPVTHVRVPKLEKNARFAVSPTPPASNIELFFSQHQSQSFRYDPSQPTMSQFQKLCKAAPWSARIKYSLQHDLQDAIALDFNRAYGEDPDDIQSWRKLCHVLNINPMPDDLEECRATVRRRHVNIVDLVDTHNTGKPVKIYPTVYQLSAYTKETGKFFPRKNREAGGVLKFMLRFIHCPSKNEDA